MEKIPIFWKNSRFFQKKKKKKLLKKLPPSRFFGKSREKTGIITIKSRLFQLSKNREKIGGFYRRLQKMGIFLKSRDKIGIFSTLRAATRKSTQLQLRSIFWPWFLCQWVRPTKIEFSTKISAQTNHALTKVNAGETCPETLTAENLLR